MAPPQGLDDRDVRYLRNLGFAAVSQLGSGTFATVYLCERRSGRRDRVAIKVMKTGGGKGNKNTREDVSHENNIIEVLGQGGGHPNVLQIEVHLDGNPLRGYFVSDLSPIGDLFHHFQCTNKKNIQVWVPMKENDCRSIFKDVTRGLQYMHNLGIAHADLKPQNILLFWRNEEPNSRADRDFPAFNRMIAKICDFGNGEQRRHDDPPGTVMSSEETCTLYYAAPEAWYRTTNAKYDLIKADVFSLGNCILAMLLGAYPYQNFLLPPPAKVTQQQMEALRLRSKRSTIQMKRDHSYTQDLCANFNPQLRDALVRLLDPNPNTRMNLTTLLRHSWMRQRSVDDSQWSRANPPRSNKFRRVRRRLELRPRARSYERGDQRQGN